MWEFLNRSYFDNTVLRYLSALATIVVGALALRIVKGVVLRRLCAWADRTQTDADDFIISRVNKHVVPLLYIYIVYAGLRFLRFGPGVDKAIGVVTLALSMFFGGRFICAVIVFLFNKYWQRRNENADPLALKWIANIIKALVWSAALLLFLDNIGVQITTLIAGLGIGGIAVAFAAQAILEDVFSFITIFFDRPFETGDFIVVDNLSGTIEHIGIKTTRVRSLGGEQLVFSNKDLTSSRLRNYKRMQKRRVSFTIRVTYDTPVEKLRQIPEDIREIITGIDNADFDRSHFFEFGDYGLVFETVYYVLSQDYGVYMDIQQKINLKIKERLNSAGIALALPTQTVRLQGAGHSAV